MLLKDLIYKIKMFDGEIFVGQENIEFNAPVYYYPVTEEIVRSWERRTVLAIHHQINGLYVIVENPVY